MFGYILLVVVIYLIIGFILLKFKKIRYRGLRKQTAKFNIMFALANLVLTDRPCLAA